ncbi:MAG: hypothetical protein OFPII_30650 [Osedax symbiont Rs1]|nr:MAG: hypothetical protein OFPII_30650 [Osedax symbiont Rs1]
MTTILRLTWWLSNKMINYNKLSYIVYCIMFLAFDNSLNSSQVIYL